MSSTNFNPLAEAIAIAGEGFGKPGAVPTIANNPGDLKVGDIGFGTINGITIFGSVDQGVTALNNQVDKMYSGNSRYYSPDMSIAQIGQTYSGGDPNWAKNVAGYLGVGQDTPINQVDQGSTSQSQNPLMSNAPFSDSNPINSGTGLFGQGTQTLKNLSVSRWASGIIGIIAIAIGLMMFKSTQAIIVNGGKALAKGAALAA